MDEYGRVLPKNREKTSTQSDCLTLLIILKAICQKKKKSKSDPLCFAHAVGLGGVGYLGFFDLPNLASV